LRTPEERTDTLPLRTSTAQKLRLAHHRQRSKPTHPALAVPFHALALPFVQPCNACRPCSARRTPPALQNAGNLAPHCWKLDLNCSAG
jgi:hypothetical protein